MIPRVLIVALVGHLRCANSSDAGDACTSNATCPARFSCANGVCVLHCREDSECGDGADCVAGNCKPRSCGGVTGDACVADVSAGSPCPCVSNPALHCDTSVNLCCAGVSIPTTFDPSGLKFLTSIDPPAPGVSQEH